MTDTIAAIASPPGNGGIGIIKISGSRSLSIVSKIFGRTKKGPDNFSPFESHRIVHGYIFDIEKGFVIDEVMLVPMLAPRSYTKEDIVEIQAHSGNLVMGLILDAVIKKGARLAEPGEFTKRAFLNGRIDLTEAEAVADIINAKFLEALKAASSQNLGNFKSIIEKSRMKLIDLLALLEVAIDFPDEAEEIKKIEEIYCSNELIPQIENQVEDQIKDHVKHQIQRQIKKQNNNQFQDKNLNHINVHGINIINEVLDICQNAVKSYEDAHFIRDGIRLVICGASNVGKSSLMNRLLEKERSIVTAIPGTTRDLIEEPLNISGMSFLIADTAGMHETDDPVEKIGIEKAKTKIKNADIILFVKEMGSRITEKEIKELIPMDKKIIFVMNKTDLVNDYPDFSLPEAFGNMPVVKISALYDEGIDLLKKTITELCLNDLKLPCFIVPNLRHKIALVKTIKSLESAKQGFLNNADEILLSIDVRNSADFLGEITGDTAGIDILDNIFKNFCMGK